LRESSEQTQLVPPSSKLLFGGAMSDPNLVFFFGS